MTRKAVNCADVQALAPEYLQRQSFPTDLHRVVSLHIEECPACAQQIATTLKNGPAQIAQLRFLPASAVGACNLMLNQISTFLSDGLDLNRRAGLQLHVANCTACRGRLKQLGLFIKVSLGEEA